MARVTVEDCVDKIPNRFELVLLAAHRARNIASGSAITVESENDRYARQVRNSAGIAVFTGQQADPAHWVEVGRCYERFALQATALGVRNAFLNQPVEVGAVRPQFASWLGVPDQRPDLVVLLDLDVEEATRRRGPATDRIEAKGLDFLRVVAEGYKRSASLLGRVVTVDASGTPEEVHARVLTEVRRAR